MAQGAVKKSAKPAKSSKKKPQALGPRKHGNRVIAPKKAKLVQASKMTKKHSAGLTALTEKKLAERAGHVELLKGGKKDKGATSKGKK